MPLCLELRYNSSNLVPISTQPPALFRVLLGKTTGPALLPTKMMVASGKAPAQMSVTILPQLFKAPLDPSQCGTHKNRENVSWNGDRSKSLLKSLQNAQAKSISLLFIAQISPFKALNPRLCIAAFTHFRHLERTDLASVGTGREWETVYLKIEMEAKERAWKMSLLPEIATLFSFLNFGGLAPQLAYYFLQFASICLGFHLDPKNICPQSGVYLTA